MSFAKRYSLKENLKIQFKIEKTIPKVRSCEQEKIVKKMVNTWKKLNANTLM